jgi:glutamate---cysteine ligase / carboxylate-amine ligase
LNGAPLEGVLELLVSNLQHVCSEVLEEGVFRAARFGVHAQLPDARGELHPVAVLLRDALEVARPHARELGCSEQLEGLESLTAHGGGAGRQHACYEITGMDGLLRELTSVGARVSSDRQCATAV